MPIKKSILIFLLGFFTGIIGVFIVRKALAPFIDRSERSDYVTMLFFKNKIELYKKYCGLYPNQKEGFNVLLINEKGACFPSTERIDEIPKNFNDEMFLYFEKENDFFIINPSSKEYYITSKNSLSKP